MYNLLQSQLAEIRGIKLLEGPGAWHRRPAPQGDRAGMDHEDWSPVLVPNYKVEIWREGMPDHSTAGYWTWVLELVTASNPHHRAGAV